MGSRNDFEKYIRVLRKIPLFYEAVESIDNVNIPSGNNFEADNKNNIEEIKNKNDLARYAIAPVLVFYTRWVLKESQKRNIHRLYFMARDGWLMYHIARKICTSEGLDIDCRYFYCSRYSLRAGAYKFFDECAYEKLFIHSYKQSARDMLLRAGLDESERKRVYNDIYFDINKESDVMGRKEFDHFCCKIRESSVFRRIIYEISVNSYPEVMRYIDQEGINKQKKIGIVDLGWTGSLEYTLRRLLNSGQIYTHITGFYLGLLEKPPLTPGSAYVTWLFNENDIDIKSWFSQNLLECICSAPHGTTLGYKRDGDKTVPVLAEEENSHDFLEILRNVSVELADRFPEKTKNQLTEAQTGKPEKKRQEKPKNISEVIYKDISLQLLRCLMYTPSDTDTEVFKTCVFCDDIGEQYHKSLIQSGNAKSFRREILPFKALHKNETDGYLWYYGSLKNGKLFLESFYRIGYRLTRMLIEHRKLVRSRERKHYTGNNDTDNYMIANRVNLIK